MTPVIIFFVALFSSTLSAMSGGGSGIINVPIFLSLGMSFPLATAVQKVNAAFWVIPAAYNYLQGRKIDWLFLVATTCIGLIGAYLGILVVLNVNQHVLKLIIGMLIVALVIHTYVRKDIGLTRERAQSKLAQPLTGFCAIILGFYESIFGSGNGILFSLMCFYVKGFEFVDALGYYFTAAFVWVTFGGLLLISKGYFNLGYMAPATIGATLGGYIGSKYARKKGNQFIKTMFVAVGGLLGLKLIADFFLSAH